MSLMGIDMGTSGCKSAIYSVSGECLASAYRSYHPLNPQPGRMEFSCPILLNAVLESMEESIQKLMTEKNGTRDPVSALSVGSFSEAVVPLSLQGEVLGNSIAGSDNRHISSMKSLNDLDRLSFYNINHNILSFTYTYPKLAWYRDKAKDIYSKVWKFLNWSDYLVYFLTGNAGSTYSHANRTLLFDVAKEQWSEELLNRVGIDKSLLADPVPSGIPMGIIKPELAVNLGFTETVQVVSGGHDQCMNALGAGAVKAGQSVTGMGTFECTTIVFDSLPDSELMLSLNLSIEHHVIAGKYVTLIYNQAGSLQTWFMKVFAKDLQEQGWGDREILTLLTRETRPGPTGIVFLPTIEPTGAPYFLPGMSGTFYGINANTTRGDLYKALLEGESMYFMDTLHNLKSQGLSMNEMIASGGGSRSDLWLQIKADLLGKRIRKTAYVDSGTVGASLLAGLATGMFSSLEEGLSVFHKKQSLVQPDLKNGALYASQIEKYQKVFHQYG